MLTDLPHIVFDVILVAVAIIGVFVFIFFERPRLQIGLMLYIAIIWSVELLIIAKGPAAAGILEFWHPIFAVSTTLAAVGIVLLRQAARKS